MNFEQLCRRFKNEHMKPDIDECDYYEVETSDGTDIMPVDVCPMPDFPVGVPVCDDDAIFQEAVKALEPYISNARDVHAIEQKHGFLVRLSAAGYMDCTDWCAFPSLQEAIDYLDETYVTPEMDAVVQAELIEEAGLEKAFKLALEVLKEQGLEAELLAKLEDDSNA